ncbi:DNA-binding transcriptional LysR family regulator [Desulfobaculum xiamenense]|uniref:DNA-binding transcriptional LysR family regulator n=1 Tax=Desulfobaculum xiamenense TaxID=995050 RepID=A0A846QRD5_9BACT|nr:LysR substrate-binding domain-containing protein [Desulfobaculum xiamenense]NJB67935.1 DNA-binding transcriptional LysR family regulator [Desulfobaculum xiamenense]
MELRHLRYFVTVAEELHFGRAAKRLNMSQPPLSQQIRQLEDELGVTLFERTSRSVELTRAGEAFRDDAYRVLSELDKAVRHARDIEAGEEGRLRIGAVSRAYMTDYPLALKAFREAYPRIALDLGEYSTSRQLRMLREGELDVGCVGVVDKPCSAFESMLLDGRQEALMVTLPDGHRLARRDSLFFKDLDGEAMITFPRCQHPECYDVLFNAFRDAGVEPRVVQETEQLETELALVASGLGFAVHFSSAPLVARRGVVFVPLDENLPSPTLWVVWRKDEKNPAVHKFIEVVRARVEAGE